MCHFLLSENSRRRLATISAILNISLVLLSLALLVAALAIRYRVDVRLELMTGYEPGALYYYLVLIACSMFLTHILAAKWCLDARVVQTRSNSHHLFLTIICLVLILALLVFIGDIVIDSHRDKIYQALLDGIKQLMASYSKDLSSKRRLDYLQLTFHCCGAASHEDWFSIAWVSLAWINIEHQDVGKYIRDGQFLKDDAPFSCCSRHSPRTCVHHSVLAYSDLTLHKEGCAQVVSQELTDQVITPTALLLTVVLITQLVCAVLMRLLQTSIQSVHEVGAKPDAAGDAYCFKSCDRGNKLLDIYKNGEERKMESKTDSKTKIESRKSNSSKGKGPGSVTSHQSNISKKTAKTTGSKSVAGKSQAGSVRAPSHAPSSMRSKAPSTKAASIKSTKSKARR